MVLPDSAGRTPCRLKVAEGRGRFLRGFDPHALRLRVLVERFDTARATVTAQTKAAERRRHVDGLVAIHPEGAGIDLRCHAMRARDVGGPYCAGKAELGIVGNRDGFFLCLEGDNADYRSKDFFTGNRGI